MLPIVVANKFCRVVSDASSWEFSQNAVDGDRAIGIDPEGQFCIGRSTFGCTTDSQMVQILAQRLAIGSVRFSQMPGLCAAWHWTFVQGCVAEPDWPKFVVMDSFCRRRCSVYDEPGGKRNMYVLNRIVVGVEMPESQPWESANLDAVTRVAVQHSFHLAASIGIPLHLIAVLSYPEIGLFRSRDEAKRRADADNEEAEQVLASLNSDYADLRVTTSSEVVFGRPWFEILRAAEASRKTLIICGTRSKSSVSRLLFGNTGHKLLRNAPGPVWLLKPQIDDDAVLDVLAATDLSEIGTDVISAGVTIGRAFPVQLTVMHALDAGLDRRMAHSGASDEEIANWCAEDEVRAEEQLHEQLSDTDFRTLATGVQTKITKGPAVACVLSTIEELDIDLLIIASSGREGIPRMLFGNTVERLLPELPCSLLTIKPDDFVCPIDVS